MIKKVPMRKCLGCNEMKPKRELVRIVRSPEGEISIDLSGKKNGRGAYICPRVDCLAALKKTKRLEKAFETKIPDEIYELLALEMTDTGG